jgi:hypothetical protein
VRSSCLALELDDVKPPQNVVEKEQRKSEDNNSDDEFAEIETTAAFRIHRVTCNSEDGDILYARGATVKEPGYRVIARDRVIAVIGRNCPICADKQCF